jgi:tetratricopeptide (TPR) repeat protein
MGHCNVCGIEQEHPFECASCARTFCAEHKLPENHQCPVKKANPQDVLKPRIRKDNVQPPKNIFAGVAQFERRVKTNPDLRNLGRNENRVKPKFSIGRYEVYQELGHGGFGIVYLIYSPSPRGIFALKTFREEYFKDATTREMFRKEANVWVELDRHPYIVRAHFVEEIAGRLYIGLEYIAPNDQGLNTLEAYLKQPHLLDLVQSLRWGIQFCHGMEYAYSKGLRCHRDIKPSNIMIANDMTVKISDFGLAGVLPSQEVSIEESSLKEGSFGLSRSILKGRGIGTRGYMPPEQYIDAGACDQRSDIYSFGVVLFQMASGGKLPFCPPPIKSDSPEELIRFELEMFRLHCQEAVPYLNHPLFPIIQRCLEKQPIKRYETFKELRSDLENILLEKGETINPPELREFLAWEWVNKGVTFGNLGRFEDELNCYDKVIEANPRYPGVWGNKGGCLGALGRFEQGLNCCNKALEIEPHKANAWNNKAVCLGGLGRFEEAVQCFNKATEINVSFAEAWTNKGIYLSKLHRYCEAINCYDRALEINSQRPEVWSNKGSSLHDLGRLIEALDCYDKALQIDPQFAGAWISKGNSMDSLNRFDEALICYSRALEIDPKNTNTLNCKANSLYSLGRFAEAADCHGEALKINPQLKEVWLNKGSCFFSLERHNDALECIDQALEVDSQFAMAWANKGVALHNLKRFTEAVSCYTKALEIDPRLKDTWLNKGISLESLGSWLDASYCYKSATEIDHQFALAWYSKAVLEDKHGPKLDAIASYKRFIDIAPPELTRHIFAVCRRLRELQKD